MKFVITVMAVWLGAVSLPAATYYVDFEDGSDSNNGTAAGSAWKHAPGDPNAAGNADITPSAGDVILFKGGVRYRGTFSIGSSGTDADPIIYKGDGWGTDKAIWEGAEDLTGWTKCTSALECGGNSNWENIYYVTVNSPPFSSSTEINLYQGDKMLAVSQYPNPEDPFFMDNTSDYLSYDAATVTSLTDDALAALGSDLVGMSVYIFAETNQMYFQEITAFNAGTNTVSFNAISKNPAGKYSLANGLNDIVLDRAGEFTYDEGTGRIYLWPLDGSDLSDVTVRLSVLKDIVELNSSNYIHFEGISAERGMGSFLYSKTSTGIEMRDCEFKYFRSSPITNLIQISNGVDCTFEDNYFTYNARLRCIVINNTGNNIKYKNNTVIKVGRSPLVFHACDSSEMVGNYIEDCTGVHSNGLTVYGLGSDYCTDVLIKDNVVINSNVSFTFQIAEDLTIVNNLFNPDGKTWSMACWNSATTRRVNVFHNSLVNSGSSRSGFFALPDGSASLPNSVIKNNIIDGMADYDSDVSHNLYTMYAVGQVSGKTGDIVNFNKDLIFNDWANGDWTLKAGSPAIDAGTDVSVTADINGTSRSAGSAPDLGCYEFDPSAIGDDLMDEGLALGGLIIPNPVRAMAGAIIINRAVLENGGTVRMFTMAGEPITITERLRAGFYLLQHNDALRRIVVVD